MEPLVSAIFKELNIPTKNGIHESSYLDTYILLFLQLLFFLTFAVMISIFS